MKKVSFLFMGFLMFATSVSCAQITPVNQIKKYLKSNYGDASETSRHFIYNAVDLNNDGKDEYLVELIGGDWCGSGGCTVLILDKNFKLNTRMTVVNDPVYIGAPGGKETTKGYLNIYIQNKDGSVAKMAWNGNKYPSNPTVAAKVDRKTIVGKFKYLNIEKQEQLTF